MATHRENNLRYYHERKLEFQRMLGGKCANCGSADNLQFHHKDDKTKLFTVTSKISYSLQTVTNEIAKCELICADCHIKIHLSPCGTLGKYRHRRCRCEQCKGAYNEYMKMYKRKRRAEGTL